MKTNECLTGAVMFGYVIRCTESDGRVVEFAHTKPADIWVRKYEDEDDAHTCSESAVRDTVNLCKPDVELVYESESSFPSPQDEFEVKKP